jgi:hypothetical protein
MTWQATRRSNNMDNNNQKKIPALVAQSLDDICKDMGYREQFNFRLGRCITQIIRFGIMGLSIPGLALFYLIFILTKNLSNITIHRTDISRCMKSMASNMHQVAEPMKAFPFH